MNIHQLVEAGRGYRGVYLDSGFFYHLNVEGMIKGITILF